MSREHLRFVIFLTIGIFGYATAVFGDSRNLDNPFEAEYILATQDTIPIEDRYGDFITDPNNNPFDLKDPAIITQDVEYDPISGQYIITEKMGDEYYRPPSYMTFEEYLDYQKSQQEDDYFKQLSGINSGGQKSISGRLDPIADIDIENSLIDRLFGGTEVDIRPQGSIDLTFGVDFSNTQDPGRTERQQRTGGFDFDMDIQMDVEGSIGDKLNLSTNYNTQATFDFDNVMKLEYGTDAFGEDDIIKSIEAGNVSLPLKGTLIQGSESLFGLKMETQWGRLRLTGIASQQKSERESLELDNGGQIQKFKVFADEYDENRHFFLTHYNRETFEQAMNVLPVPKSIFQIQRIQVWVKPRGNEVVDVREVVAIADLGEPNPNKIVNENPIFQPPSIPLYTDLENRALPANDANPIYEELITDPQNRFADRVVSKLNSGSIGFRQGIDYEKIQARLLSPSEFTYHPTLGFISLNVNIPPDQVVGVAFEYSYQDQVHKVGELAQDVGVVGDTSSVNQNVLFVKMLKSTVQRVNVPTWDLMMKNVYSIGGFQIGQEDFRFNILYDDPGKGRKTFLPETNLANIPLLEVFGLDRLNTQQDPQPDGIFDYVDGVTIIPRSGKIIFPKLEPFGSALRAQISDPVLADKYTFDTLYSNTVTIAREFAEENRFTLEGSYKSSVSSDISLGAFNIPEGSEQVFAGGRKLVRNVDYEIDYTIGRIRILDESILNSGSKIRVDFEDNTLFGFQTKTMLGVRADFEASKNLNIGATWMQLFERPFTQKVNVGDDPINNKIYGLDVTYSNEAPWLTKAVDKLPLYSTKAPSSINFTAETAYLRPGHSKAINEGQTDPNQDDKGGVNYIDDFEGTTSPISLLSPVNGPNGWSLASTPRNEMFPESDLTNDLRYGANRALLNWMRIEPANSPNPYVDAIEQEEVFPNVTPINNVNSTLPTLSLSYCPDERGPYNFDPPSPGTNLSAGLNQEGKLVDPGSRWGGIMRSLTTNDFQASNIEFIEFWMLNPYLSEEGGGAVDPLSSTGFKDGNIYFELGNVSEDILKDSRKMFENGLPGPNNPDRRTTDTQWGRIPLTPQITTSFDINPANRTAQDVGLDGLPDSLEVIKYQSYLDALIAGGVNPDTVAQMAMDPSNDNFRHFRSFDNSVPILDRYRRFSGLEGNSPTQGNNNLPTSSTTLPDTEDLDRDRTLNENEAYFQYKVPIEFDGVGGIDVENNPFITDQISTVPGRTWYRFKVPLLSRDVKRVGGIENFRSIRFIRMYLKDFQTKMNLRFATLDLVRNQWRRYTREVNGLNPGEFGCLQLAPEESEVTLDVNAVSIEENTQKIPFGYVLPPGIVREQALGVNVSALQNERSIALRLEDLPDGEGQAIYKLTEYDLRNFKRLKLFVHAESINPDDRDIEDGDVTVFIRLGSDFTQNYYEYEIPVEFSKRDEDPGGTNAPGYQDFIWKFGNRMDISFDTLTLLKQLRNNSGYTLGQAFPPQQQVYLDGRGGNYRIKGNPNLGDVKTIMIGVRNPCATDTENLRAYNVAANDPNSPGAAVGRADDGRAHNVEIWVNELRAFGLDERGGAAATARLDMQLADLGSLTLSGLYSTVGFGQVHQQLAERAQESTLQYDIATDINLDKFLPEKWGLNIPMYYQYSKEVLTPEYDPYDLDVELKDNIRDNEDPNINVKERAQTVTTIQSLNFTNVKKERTNTEKKPMPWDISNFSFSYKWEERELRDPFVEKDKLTIHRGAVDYQFARKVKYIEPFKKLIKGDKLDFIKNINFNPLPNSFTFTTELDRRFNTVKYRFSADDILLSTYYNKYFNWNRTYDVQWDLFRALKIQYFADFKGVIDEPAEKDLIARNRLSDTDPNYISDVDQARKDAIWDEVGNLGRPKNFNQGIRANFKVPLKNFFFLDWIDLTATYDANYTWQGASLAPEVASLGNTISNDQNRSAKAKLKFDKLYKKSKYLGKIDKKPRPSRGSRGNTSRPTRPDRSKDKDDDKKEKKDREPSKLERALIRPFLLLRSLDVDYRENFQTTIPGFAPEVELFGMNNFDAPGYDFVFGAQPNLAIEDWYSDKDWLYTNYEWISTDPYLGSKGRVLQSKGNDFKAKMILEPFRKFKITLNADRNHTEYHEEGFARQEDNPNVFQEDYIHQAPYEWGSYKISYSALSTLFDDSVDDIITLFNQFEDNRVIIANRLNPNGNPHEFTTVDSLSNPLGFPQFYGRGNQNTSIPAFIAAYTGQDASKVKISEDYTSVLTNFLPKVNWRLSYDGLKDLPWFKEIFQSFSVTHGYQSTLNVNRFETNSAFFDPNEDDFNDLTLDYHSKFNVPDVVIDEAFSPLIGIKFRTKSDMSFDFEAKKSRNLRMGFLDERLQESQTKEYRFSFGYTLKEVEFDFLSKKKKKGRGEEEADKPDPNSRGGGRGRGRSSQGEPGDLNINFTFSLRDDVTFTHLWDQDVVEPSRGTKTLSISPSADYRLNKQLLLRFFFDYRRNTPKTSQGFPRTDIQSGITVSFQLQ